MPGCCLATPAWAARQGLVKQAVDRRPYLIEVSSIRLSPTLTWSTQL